MMVVKFLSFENASRENNAPNDLDEKRIANFFPKLVGFWAVLIKTYSTTFRETTFVADSTVK